MVCQGGVLIPNFPYSTQPQMVTTNNCHPPLQYSLQRVSGPVASEATML
jgi:hypothetical protein